MTPKEEKRFICRQKGKVLSNKELDLVGKQWFRQLHHSSVTDKSMPYHFLRE